MGDSFTNLLLMTLITLIGFIGKVFYQKIESFYKKLDTLSDKLESIIISDIKSNNDVDQIKKEVGRHEIRITDLEKKL